MNTRYTILVEKIIDDYIKNLKLMYFWDARCNEEPHNHIYTETRNLYATQAAVFHDLLCCDGMSECTIDGLHELAKKYASMM